MVHFNAMTVLAKSIGEVIKALRRARDMSLDSLATRAGLCRGTIIAIESPDCNPTIKTIEAVAEALGVSTCAIISAASALDEQKARIEQYRSSDYRRAEAIGDEEIEWLKTVPVTVFLGESPSDKAITMLILARRETTRSAA